MTKNSEHSKQKRQKFIKDGKCQICGMDRDRKEIITCQKCLNRITAYGKTEKAKQQKKEWYNKLENKEKIKERSRKYKKEHHNLPEYKQKHNEYEKNRRNKLPAYKIICNLRHRVYLLLKGRRKNVTTKDCLGCSAEELIKHIESQWEEGMSWENYGNKDGGWTIDHIKPFCKCNQNDVEELARNNHWTNLRPLWNKENFGRTYEEYD